MNCDMKRSISLYSYQDEYYDGKLDLEGCLRETAKTGATGVELLAEQMIKKFPQIMKSKQRSQTNISFHHIDLFSKAQRAVIKYPVFQKCVIA